MLYCFIPRVQHKIVISHRSNLSHTVNYLYTKETHNLCKYNNILQ